MEIVRGAFLIGRAIEAADVEEFPVGVIWRMIAPDHSGVLHVLPDSRSRP